MWGGKVGLPTRVRVCTANTTEIADIAGQKILFSGRASIMFCGVQTSGAVRKINSGDTIKAKTHAEIATTAHLSTLE